MHGICGHGLEGQSKGAELISMCAAAEAAVAAAAAAAAEAGGSSEVAVR